MKDEILNLQTDKKYFINQVLQCIGEVNSNVIKDIIDVSNKEKYIFHGVKDDSLFSLIDKEGVKNLTPEGGYVSFWTTGTRLFGSMLENKLCTYDSTFFHYAHSHQSNVEKSANTIVVANYSELEKLGIQCENFKENGYLTIKDVVPRNAIHILRAELHHENKNLALRDYSKAVERISLNQIHTIIKKGYEPGSITTTNSSL